MYFDIQVNGAFGVDFNDSKLTCEKFQSAVDRLVAIKVKRFMPTIITDDIDTMCSRIQRISSFVNQSSTLSEIIAGIHVEGPFLSPADGFRGTHAAHAIRVANVADMGRVLDAGQGLVRLVTLAPEQDPKLEVLKFLVSRGVKVFAGHTDASIDCLIEAVDCGLSGFTHLGNGCPLEMHRHDNIIQRVFSLSDRLYISLIADGVHLPVWLLESWLKKLPRERVILTSDSMSAAGMPPGEYWIGGQPILVDEDRRTRHRDHQYLAGSASTMLDMDRIISPLPFSESAKRAWLFGNAKALFS
ncbi:N-acetylglucosamine-6-phosphate deacetylase [Pirellulaceae bacterium SH449]